MYEDTNQHPESNQALLVEEGSTDPTGLLGKLKTLIRETEEETANRRKTQDTGRDQECSKEKLESKSAPTRLAEFDVRATVLVEENDRLREEVGKKSKASNNLEEFGDSNDERTIEDLKTENSLLRDICYEISGVNKGWQKYNKEVQLYIRQLEEVVQAKNPKWLEVFSEDTWAIPRERETLSRSEDADIPLLTGYNKLLKEVHQLQRELEASRKTVESLRRQLQDQHESSESIRLLNCQLSLYKEDYEAERQEKKAALATSTELSKELNHVRSQLRECKRRLKEVQEVSRPFEVKSPCRSPDFVLNMVREGRSSRSGHLSADGSSDGPEIPEPSTSSNSEQDEEAIPQTISAYECPGCGITFPSNRDTDYLEHYEECQRIEGS